VIRDSMADPSQEVTDAIMAELRERLRAIQCKRDGYGLATDT